ncbi:MAG TPA: NADPH-dependent FMN reductase [Stellaceae bacterium]|nr:NADPH-dependent FMN reductase [Stellaceae bacterium]
MKLVLVVGAATPPGRLNSAIAALAASFAARRQDATVETINLATARCEICDGRKSEDYDATTQATVAAIGAADAVLFAAPVYRASFPGVLKNLLDLLPVEALRDKPVGIVAMGATPHHYLGVDAHMRMVLAWFGALTLPNSVYLTGKDFAEGRLSAESAIADLDALGDALATLAAAVRGHSLGPVPLAARFT